MVKFQEVLFRKWTKQLLLVWFSPKGFFLFLLSGDCPVRTCLVHYLLGLETLLTYNLCKSMLILLRFYISGFCFECWLGLESVPLNSYWSTLSFLNYIDAWLIIHVCRLLQNNAISGRIPAAIGSLEKLQTLDLSNNTFSGEIPSSLGGLKNLNYL